jgi:hypothetical protein
MLVPICKVEKCFSNETKKLILTTDFPSALRKAVHDSMKQTGAKLTTGPAPRGWMEHQLMNFLDGSD